MEQVSVARRGRFFHGWWIVGLGFLSNLMGVGIGTYSLAVFIKPMTGDSSLGFTRTEIVWAFTIGIVFSTLTGPWVGSLLDTKHGARIVTVIMGITGSAGIALMSQVQQLWQVYILLGVVAGSLFHHPPFMLASSTVPKWFIRRRGQVLALSLMGIPVAGLVFTPLTQALISTVEWRSAWLILGISTAVIFIPTHGLLMRGRPEDMGLRPDGEAYPTPHVGSETIEGHDGDPETAWTLKLAMKTQSFWLILLCNNLGLGGLLGVLVNQVAYLEDELPNDEIAVAAVTVFAVFSLIGMVPWVFLADRFDVKYSTISMMLLCAIGMIFLINVSVPAAFTYAVIFGVGTAGIDLLISLVWANYFGRAFLGTIKGFVTLTNVISTAGAPLFGSYMFDATGDYRNAFIVFLGGFVFGALLLLIAKKPEAPPIEREERHYSMVMKG